jgi:hypothetical protein
MHRNLLTAVAVVASLLLTTDASAETVAGPNASTTVREYQGTIVFSQRDASTGEWRLMTHHAGTGTLPVPIRPSERPFDADIGPDSNGRPQLIYTRCDETCDLFVSSLANDTGERAVRNANDPEHHDVHPTLWRGRIAWARIYGEQIDRKVVVYTKALTAPRSRPSTRLPGVPSRGSTARSVDSLELWGDNLAQVVGYGCGGCSGISQTELRLVRVSDRNASQIAFQVVGLSGQQLVGPSFANGWLSWYRACLGDPSACQGGRANPWRYNLRLRRWAKGAGGPIRVDGFVDTMAYHLRVESCSPETSEASFNAGCRIEKVPAPDYEAASAPRR